MFYHPDIDNLYHTPMNKSKFWQFLEDNKAKIKSGNATEQDYEIFNLSGTARKAYLDSIGWNGQKLNSGIMLSFESIFKVNSKQTSRK